MSPINDNALIQIGGSEKSNVVLELKLIQLLAAIEALALMSQFSQQPRIQREQEFSSHHLELDASKVDVPVSKSL